MENTDRMYPQTGGFDAREGIKALENLRRTAWKTLLDLGLTDDEIVAYFETDPDMGKPADMPDGRALQ